MKINHLFLIRMNYFDIIVIIPMAWSLYKGFTKGFVIEVATLLALVLGIYGGLNFSNYASDWLKANWDVSAKLLPIFSFFLTFIAIVLVIHMIARLIEKFVKLAALGIVNRLMGAIFSLAKVILISSVLVYILDTIDLQYYDVISDEFREESVLYEPLSVIAPTILPLFTKWQSIEIMD